MCNTKPQQPGVTLGQYKGLAVSRRDIAPTRAQLDEALRALRYRHAQWVEEAGPAARRDKALLDFAGFFPDGTPIPDSASAGVEVILGQGKMLPGVEDAILGHKAGETFDLPFTYPADFRLRSLAGRTVRFSITLHQVWRRPMPAANDAFAQSLGRTDLVELLNDLYQETEDKNRRLELQRVENLLLDTAANNMQVSFPAGVLEQKAEAAVRSLEDRLLSIGQKPAEYYVLCGHDRAWHLADAKAKAELEWRRRLAVQAIAEAEGVSVSAGELAAEKARLAQSSGEAGIKALTDDTVQFALAARKVRRLLLDNAVPEGEN